MNTFLYLLEKYSDLPWRYNDLSRNPNISLKYIKNNPDEEWNWKYISKKVTYKEFIDNPDLPWDYLELSNNTNIPLEYIKDKLSDKLNLILYFDRNDNLLKNYGWFNISERVTNEEFENNPDLPWDYTGLSYNKNIPLDYIKNNLDKIWNWKYISQRVTYEELINNPNLPWNYKYLSQNPNIPFKYIKNNLYENRNVILVVNTNVNLNINCSWYKYLDWSSISKRVTYEELIDNPELPWNYDYLSGNLNIPLGYIKNNLDKKWDWSSITHRVTYKELIDNPELPWNCDELSQNPNISLKYIKNNLDKNWDWFCISYLVTYEEFIDNPELPWEYNELCYNKNIPFKYKKNILKINFDWFHFSAIYEEFINNQDFPFDYQILSDSLLDYESRILAKKIMNIIINDEKYIAKVYNPNRMRSVKSICELEELKTEFGWSDEEFDKYVK